MPDLIDTSTFARIPSPAELGALVDLAPDAIFVADPNGRFTFVNEAACLLLGYAIPELIGKALADVFPAEYVERVRTSRDPLHDAGSHLTECRLRRKDATSIATEVSARILPDDQWHGFVRDISKRRAHEDGNRDLAGAFVLNEDIAALHETQDKQWTSEHLLRVVFDLLPVGLWIADREGRITLANPAGNTIWQGTRYVGPDHYSEYVAWWLETGKRITHDEWGMVRALREGKTSRGELIRIQCFDGSFKTVINWAAAIRSEAGEIVGAIALNEDITSLQQTQEQLRAAVREREEILAMVTHDLRNPLNAIMLGATSAESKARAMRGGEPVRALASSLIRMCRHMSGMVEDLLAIAVATTGGQSMLKPARVAAADLVARAADAARPQLAKASLQLELDVNGELPMLDVDADRILRVFANLLDNAVRFSSGRGSTTIAAEATASGVKFSVANSGPPLPPDQLETMFQTFWQAGRDRGGAGLGLSICRFIVEAHGGSVWAEAAEGSRVRVCFVLPRAVGQ